MLAGAQFTVVPDVIPRSAVAEVAANVLRAGEEIRELMVEHIKGGFERGYMREELRDLASDALARRGFVPDGKSARSIEQHNALLDEIVTELRRDHDITDAYNAGVPTGRIDPGVNHIAHYPGLAPYLADPRVLGIAKAMMDPHVRIAQLELPKTNQPATPERLEEGWESRRGYHSDWPHDINHVAGGHVAQPFPDVTMAISTVWYLVDVGPENGST